MTKSEKTNILLWSLAGATTLTIFWIYRKQIQSGVSKGFQALSDFVNNLTNVALNEYNFWQGGSIKEGDARTMERLRQYWREGAGVNNWTDAQMKSEAWSAAFISYIMKKSGAGSDWKYSPSHSTYIVDSIKNRKENNSKPFKGYRPEEVKLEVGDLVGKARQSGVGYDTTGAYKSHTDVVVKIKDGYADTIGGNVGDTVKITKVPLTPDGKIDLKRSNYFVVIKNKK